MSEEKPLRLFVAASVPERELLWLRDETVALRERWPQARWTRVEGQHITLKFLGSTPRDRLEEVAAVCASVAQEVEPSEVALEGLGVFPSLRRARVLWAGLEDPHETLSRVAADLDEYLEPLGYPVEKRRFTPHLTLARFREPARMTGLPVLPAALPFVAGGFGLWRSRLSPRGAHYERLLEFPLGHSA